MPLLSAVSIVAAENSSGFSGDVFLQYGVLGVVAGALVVYTRASILREQKRSDELTVKNDALNLSIQEKMIPALITATRSIQEANDLLLKMRSDSEASQKSTEALHSAQKLLADMQFQANVSQEAARAAAETQKLASDLRTAQAELMKEMRKRPEGEDYGRPQ